MSGFELSFNFFLIPFVNIRQSKNELSRKKTTLHLHSLNFDLDVIIYLEIGTTFTIHTCVKVDKLCHKYVD